MDTLKKVSPRLLPLGLVASPTARDKVSNPVTVSGEVAFYDPVEDVIPRCCDRPAIYAEQVFIGALIKVPDSRDNDNLVISVVRCEG
jgi:hypothetical protein